MPPLRPSFFKVSGLKQCPEKVIKVAMSFENFENSHTDFKDVFKNK